MVAFYMSKGDLKLFGAPFWHGLVTEASSWRRTVLLLYEWSYWCWKKKGCRSDPARQQAVEKHERRWETSLRGRQAWKVDNQDKTVQKHHICLRTWFVFISPVAFLLSFPFSDSLIVLPSFLQATVSSSFRRGRPKSALLTGGRKVIKREWQSTE